MFCRTCSETKWAPSRAILVWSAAMCVANGHVRLGPNFALKTALSVHGVDPVLWLGARLGEEGQCPLSRLAPIWSARFYFPATTGRICELSGCFSSWLKGLKGQ